MENKTQLSVVVRKSKKTDNIIGMCIASYGIDRWDEYSEEKECYVHRRKGKKLFDSQIGIDQNGYTDLFVAVSDEYAPKMVYTCLKTIYAKSPNEKIDRLMKECKAYAKSMDSNREEYECSISEDIDMYIPDSMTISDVMEEHGYAEGHVLQKITTHKYIMVDGEDGKKHRTEIIPYDTLDNTRFGMVRNGNINIADGVDCEDLIQIAKLAMTELVNVGLVSSVTELWNYAGYVYKAINAEIQKEKKKDSMQDSLIVVDENKEEHTVTIAAVDKELAKVERNAVLDKLIDIIRKKCDKRSDPDRVVLAFKLLYIDGHGQEAAAKRMGVHQRQITRYICTIRKVLSSPDVHEALSACIAI